MNKRRRLTGVVKSNKMTKTVIVEVSRTYQHPLYHKVVRSTKAYKAHDELGCNVGDEVVIVESAPISATVRWNVEKIVKVEVRQEGVESTSEAIEEVEELIEASCCRKGRGIGVKLKKLAKRLRNWLKLKKLPKRLRNRLKLKKLPKRSRLSSKKRKQHDPARKSISYC